MPDLDLAELDRLHEKQEADRFDPDVDTDKWYDAQRTWEDRLVSAYPSLRARIAELERKAAAWDAVKGNIHEAASGTGKFEGYECDAWWHEEHPTTKAISAAVAAKESKHD